MMNAKKKTMGPILFFTCLSVLFFMTGIYAGSTTTKKPVSIGDIKNVKPIVLPDLIVQDISLNNSCAIRYTIKNVAKAGVPAEAYQNPSKAFLRFYDGAASMGGISLQDLDPNGSLKNGGGKVFGTALPGNYNPAGSHNIRIVVDEINIVKEFNESNNELTKPLACAPPIQIQKLSIGSDAAGNCYVHIFLKNQNGNTSWPLSAAKASFSNRSSWNKIEWGNPKVIFFTSYKNTVPYNSTCPNYPCAIHVSIDSTFIKDVLGRYLDGDYDGVPGGNFVQNITVSNAGSWGVFNH